jgi:hypothetical protein
MVIPGPGQTVHQMSRRDMRRALRHLRHTDGRSFRALRFSATDELRRLYHETNDDLIRLRDGLVRRFELFAEIKRREFRALVINVLVLGAAVATVIAAVAAVIAAVEGW